MVDVIVIGAGAAGLMTAIIAARRGAKVVLLDGREKIGAKILMSGGTRCNVTNKNVTEKDYQSKDLMRVRHILRAFDNQATIQFFEELGVELVLEDTDKYFPKSNTAKTILDALLNEVKRLHITCVTSARVTEVVFKEGVYTVRGSDFSHESKSVVIATGGLSYPSTGSDGAGYHFAKLFGHGLIETTPALTPLLTDDQAFCSLSGISLTVALCLKLNSKKVFHTHDGFLFTHHGFSGPAALDVSRHWLRQIGSKTIEVNFLPMCNENTLAQSLQEGAIHTPKKTIKNFLTEIIPERLSLCLLAKARVAPETLLNQLKKDRRVLLIATCIHHALPVTGVVGYQKAEVTAGGINMCQLNPKTLESLHQKGLYFVGEICDVDGRIGGFNFQWAWASGYVVGTSLGETQP